jgi:gamma-glutamyltranspeptidase/glutathione hydrolase
MPSITRRHPLAEAIAAPRLHTEGNASIEFEKEWPEDEAESFRQLGYTVKTGGSAVLSAVARENARLLAAMR